MLSDELHLVRKSDTLFCLSVLIIFASKVQAHLKNPDYSNESVVEYFEKYLKTISRETVSATVQLSSEQRMSFIEMTPLLFCVEKDCVDWRTLTHLTIEADVLIGMY